MDQTQPDSLGIEKLYTYKCKHSAPWRGELVLKEFWTIPLCPECRQERIDSLPKARDMYEFVTALHHMLDIGAIGVPQIPVLRYRNASFPRFLNGSVIVTGTDIALMPAVGQWELLRNGARMDVIDESEAMKLLYEFVMTDDNIAKARVDFFNGDIEGGTGFEQCVNGWSSRKRSRPAFCRG